MDNSGLVSIVVPVYNVQDYLEECILSLVQQTYNNIEIILVNDGSTDKSGEICSLYAENDFRISLIEQTNSGLSMARNTGIEVANGEYITFVDSDDYLKKNAIELLISAIKTCNADIAVARMSESEEMFRSDNCVAPFVQLTSYDILKMIFQEKQISTSASAKLYRRDIWNDLRFPKGKIFEDYFTIYKVIDKVDKCVFIDNFLYYYRPNPSSIMKADFDVRKLQYFEATDEIIAYISNKYPSLIVDINNRTSRYAISFFKAYSQSGKQDKIIEKCLVEHIKKNILRYFFSRYSVYSKMYGLLVCISPKIALKMFK